MAHVSYTLNENPSHKNMSKIHADMYPFEQDKILVFLKITTIFYPTSKIFIECAPNITQISILITLTIEVLGPTTTHIFNMNCCHIHVVFAHNKGFLIAIIRNYTVILINIKLRQSPFNCDSSLATITVSQSSENSVSSQQNPNPEQHSSTEASCPAY
ncbi:hypothetical protein TNCV_2232931 [Trichonephila clavipes]|nr:hypothetical protein TNCV_2232931 [Trichonephila clavipes]